jgi:hypothetical protein
VEQVVVQAGREQVVGTGHRVEVAGEVEVDVVGRHHLGAPAAGPAALDPEAGAEGRLPEGDHRAPADPAEGLAEPDGHGGLAVAGRRGSDGRDEDEVAVGLALPRLQRAQVDLRLVVAVGEDIGRVQPQPGRHVQDGPEGWSHRR